MSYFLLVVDLVEFLVPVLLPVFFEDDLLAAAFVPVDFAADDVFVAVERFVVRAEFCDVDLLVEVPVVVERVAVRPVLLLDVVLAVVREEEDLLVAAFVVEVLALLCFGSFFAPLMTSLKCVPARKAGTLVFFTRTASPVCGLRAVRAARARFSKTPKPVIVTFSPLLTSRTIISTRLLTASEAVFLSPRRSPSISISSALLAIEVLHEEQIRTRPILADLYTRYY